MQHFGEVRSADIEQAEIGLAGRGRTGKQAVMLGGLHAKRQRIPFNGIYLNSDCGLSCEGNLIIGMPGIDGLCEKRVGDDCRNANGCREPSCRHPRRALRASSGGNSIIANQST
jgi:hypothetical protein